MIYRRVVGCCPALADKIEELVAEKFSYEYFDDPISDARFQQQWGINRLWYRKQLLDAVGGICSPADLSDDVEAVRKSIIGDETLEALFMMFRPFILQTSEEGFYAVDCIEANDQAMSIALQIEENNKRKFLVTNSRAVHET